MIGMIVTLVLLAGACAWIGTTLTVWVRDDWQATMRADDSNNTTDLLRAAARNVRLIATTDDDGKSKDDGLVWLRSIWIWLWLAPKLLAYWIRSA
jgi:hypothetical protein